MYCRHCGALNDANAYRCIRCSQVLREEPGLQVQPVSAGSASAPLVPNYLVHSILVTLFCCLPFGIAAIVHSSQVNAKLAAGDHVGAVAASENAKKFCWWSVAFGGLVTVAYLVFVVGAGASL